MLTQHFSRIFARIAAALALAVTLLPVAGAAQGVERHYIANDDHTDYYWSGDAATYRRVFLDTLDFYMQQAEDTANRPVDGRGRYNADGSLWIWEYEHNRPAADFNRLLGHIRAGDVSVPFQSLVLLPGAMPTEAVLRDMYYAGSLERRFGLDLDLVVAMENQTLPVGLASLWAGSGAKYSWRGVCACATFVPLNQLIDRPREIYRFTGLDGASVILKWNSMLGNNRGLGGYAEARDPAAIVDFMSRDGLYHLRWPWNIHAAFGYGWDDLQSQTNDFIDAAAALGRPNRRVIVSNEVDFFRDFEASHGAELESYGKAFGNEWDLYVASMQSVAAPFRRALAKLRTAEALAATVLSNDAAAIGTRDAERARAFLNMGLFYEHDWVANGDVPREQRVQFQRDTLSQVQGYVNGVHGDALAALGRQVSAGAAGNPRYAVFNALGFVRTGPADLPHPGVGPFTVIDVTTGDEVPSQVVPEGLRILATGVPSVGHRVYEVRAGAGQAFGDAAQVGAGTLDNGIVTLHLRGDGAVDRVVINATGRALLGPGGVWNLQAAAALAPIRTVEAGPVSVSLEVDVATAPRHRTRVTLYRGLDRVEIRNHVSQNFSDTVGYTFDFALQNQVLRHEEVGAVVRVGRARDGGDYADTGTRTDFLTLNHFLDMSEPNFGVTLTSKDSQFFRAGNSDAETLDTVTPRVFAVLGMQVDGRHLGIIDQGYDEQFDCDFALRAHGRYDAAEAMRFGLDFQTPLVAVRAVGDAAAPLPPDRGGMLHLETNDAVLFALKPSEAGIASGLMARLWNLAEDETTVSVRPDARALTAVRHVSHVEVDGEPAFLVDGALEDTLPRQGLRSYRLSFGDEPPPPPPPDAAVEPPRADAAVVEPVADAAVVPPGADARGVEPPVGDGAVVEPPVADGAVVGPGADARVATDASVVARDGLVPVDGRNPVGDGRTPVGDGRIPVGDGGVGGTDASAPGGDVREPTADGMNGPVDALFEDIRRARADGSSNGGGHSGEELDARRPASADGSGGGGSDTGSKSDRSADGGCGCRLGPAATPEGPIGVFGASLVALILRRRRRRRGAPRA